MSEKNAKSYVVRGTNEMYSRNEIIDDDNVVFKITDWDFSQRDSQTIILRVEVLSGVKKGVTNITDFVTFDPKSRMNWKYKQLRSAINMPIPKEGEDVFDLLDLIGKIFVGDLRKSKDGRYQNIQYKRYSDELIDKIMMDVDLDEDVEGSLHDEIDLDPISDDDLPF